MIINKQKHHNKGFTLIEILLYISIVSLLLFTVGISSQAFLEARVKNQVIANVNHQGANAMNFILQAIRNASSIDITVLAAGATGNTIELAMPATPSGKNPTCFRLSSSKIQIQEGTADCAGTWVDLTDSTKVTVDEIGVETGIFSNLSRTGTPGIIRIRFNVAHVEPAVNRYFQDFDTDFQGAAALR